MNKSFSKLLISFLAGIVILLSLPIPAFAQSATGPWYDQTPQQWLGKVFGGDQNEIFGERYTYAQTKWIMYSVIVIALNMSTGGQLSGCLTTWATGQVSGDCTTEIKNVLSAMRAQANSGKSKTSLFAQLFNQDRPISAITYARGLGQKFNLIPQAKAQSTGFGYNVLGQPTTISNLWSAVRDVAYAAFVVVIIAFAFMIMFRVKISPQVVVSVQSALPKIAIGLILVTFSFAIAGFLIDIMYLAMGVVALIFSHLPANAVFGTAGNLTAADYFSRLTVGPGNGLGIFGIFLEYFINFITAGLIAGISVMFSLGGTAACVAHPLLAAGANFVMAAVFLILLLIGSIVLIIILILNFFKVIWLLTKTFLMIILLVIFSPLMLAAGVVIPGMGFGSWVKSLFSKLAIYPMIGVLYLLSFVFLQQSFNALGLNGAACPTWPQGWPPLLGGSPQLVAFLFLLSSLGIFMMIPKAGDMIEGFFAGKGFNYGSAIGDTLGAPFRVVPKAISGADSVLDAALVASIIAQGRGANPNTRLGRAVSSGAQLFGLTRGGRGGTTAP